MKRNLVITLLAASLLPVSAYSQQVPSSAQPEQVEKRFQDNIVLHEKDNIEIKTPKQEKINKQDTRKILKLNNVKFKGNTVYSNEELKKLASEYIGKQVSFADLQTIAESITQKYRNDGYILSKAVLSPQKIDGGTVTVDIVEGYISEVNLTGEVKGDVGLLRKYAEKISKARPINKRDLERYLLLADDLPGVTARSLIRPSTKVPGSSELILNLQHKTTDFSVSADNFGSRFIGPYEMTAVAAINSAFGRYERTTVRAISSLPLDELTFFDVQQEEQLDSEGTKLKARIAHTSTHPGSRLESLDIDGVSTTIEAVVSHPLIRSRKENLEINAGIRGTNSQTDISSTNIAEDRVRTISQGMSYEFEDFLRSANKFSLTAIEGFKGLGSTNDGLGRSRTNANEEFIRGVLDYARLQEITQKISLLLSGEGQYSNSPLLASEEIAFGGRTYGRGYDPAEITGDQGAAGLAELRFSSDYSNSYITSVQYYVSYDVAGVWNKDPVVGESERQTLASVAAGVRFNLIKNYTGDLSVGVPMTRKVNAEGKSGDEARAFLSITKRF